MLGSNISVIAVFLEGLLSFFSPCVLPLLPVYIGYLSGGAVKEDAQGIKTYNRRVVLINTIFFIINGYTLYIVVPPICSLNDL